MGRGHGQGADAGMNIVDNILHQCRLNPPAAALIAPDFPISKVSYARLAQFIHTVSGKAVSLGLARRDLVALQITDPVLHAAFALGLARAGIATVSDRPERVAPRLSVAAVLTDGASSQAAQRVIRVGHNWIVGSSVSVPNEVVPLDEGDDLCRVVISSARTGNGRPIGLTHAMLGRRIGRHMTIFGARLPLCTRTYCDLDLATSVGFQFLIYTLWRGGTFVFPGVDAGSTLRAFEAYRVENVVSAPARLEQWLRIYASAPALQSNLATVLSCGSELPPEFAAGLRARMCPQVITAYGSAEADFIAAAAIQMLPDTAGAAGFVTPGVSVEVVDDHGQRVGAGQEGHVRVRGAFSVMGYLGESPGALHDTFRDGWFYPGGLGRLNTDGMLTIRQRDIVN